MRPARRRGEPPTLIAPGAIRPTDGPINVYSASRLGERYRDLYSQMLYTVAGSIPDPDLPLVPFWPLRGASYDRELLVIGRSVNGWVNDWTVRQLCDRVEAEAAVDQVRSDAEPVAGDRMAWVVDLWRAPSGYNTARSAFWRVIRRISCGDRVVAEDWPSRLVWTNLYKVSPAFGWNPGADMQRAQRGSATELLKFELATFAPRRVLALTGSWMEPFRVALGVDVERRNGLVEGFGMRGAEAWVVAKHPMGKPGTAFVTEVLKAFEELGIPL